MGPHVFLVDDGGGSAPAASDSNSLDAAITAAQAFNTSWQEAVDEIGRALVKEVGVLDAKLKEVKSAVNKIAEARDNALADIQAAKGSGPPNADNADFQDDQNAGYCSDGPCLSPDGP